MPFEHDEALLHAAFPEGLRRAGARDITGPRVERHNLYHCVPDYSDPATRALMLLELAQLIDPHATQALLEIEAGAAMLNWTGQGGARHRARIPTAYAVHATRLADEARNVCHAIITHRRRLAAAATAG